MKSTLSNMVLVLFVITLIAAAMLGVVYNVTKEPIEAAKTAKTTNALAQAMPKFDNNPATDTVTCMIDGMPIKVYKGTLGGEVSGYAVETMTKNGFGGEIKMMVGFKPDGEIVNIEVLQHGETPGLGSKMAEPGNVLLVSFQGKNPKDLKMSVRKDGGDIDVITASTISSRAYVDAVERGYKAFQNIALGGAAVNEQHAAQKEADTCKVVVVNEETGVYYDVEASAQGLVGPIRLVVRFSEDGIINDITVVEQNETEGYGARITDPNNAILASIKGEKACDLKWSFKSDGGSVDGISGATVTSKAYMQAVQSAYTAYQSYILKEQNNE